MKTPAALILAVLLPFSSFAVPLPGTSEDKPPVAANDAELEKLMKDSGTAPITIPKESTTTREFQQKYLAWLKRMLRSAIEREVQGGLADKAKSETVNKAITWWHDHESNEGAGTLLTDLRKLIPDGSSAPVLQFLAGEIELATGQTDQALARFDITAAAKDVSKTPPIVAMLGAYRLLTEDKHADYEEVQRVSEHVLSVLKPEACKDEDAPFILHIFETQFSGFLDSYAEQLAVTFRETKAPEWMRLALLGLCEIHLAWEARGSGWASSVSKEGWKGFEQHLALAREALTKSWKLKPDRPEAATHMITVAMAGKAERGDTWRTWFDRAIAAQCDYLSAYERAVQTLLPRWGGSTEKMRGFAAACALAGRYDTLIPNAVHSAISAVVSEEGDWREVYRKQALGKIIIKNRLGQIKNATDDGIKARLRSRLAIEAWMAGDYAASVEAFAALKKDEAKRPVLSSNAKDLAARLGFDWLRAYEEARVLSSKWAKTYTEIGDARTEGRFDAALRNAEGILKDAATKEYAFLATLPDLISFERAAAKGDWVKMPLNREVWFPSGDWNTDKDQRLLARAPDQAPGVSLFRGQLGPRFEVRGNVTLPKREGEEKWVGFGAIAGHANEFDGDGDMKWFKGFVYTEDHKSTIVYSGATPAELAASGKRRREGPELVSDGPNSFRLRRYDDRVSFWLNNQLVADKLRLPSNAAADECNFGLIALSFDAKDPVTFTELEARRIRDDE